VAFPHVAASREPLLDNGQGPRFHLACADATRFLGSDHAAFLQQLDVLHNGCQGYPKRFGNLAHRRLPTAQLIDDSPTRWIGQRTEDAIHRSLMVNHLL